MAKRSGVVAHFDDAHLTKIFHRLHDGDWAYETVQNVDPILDANKGSQNHDTPTGDLRMTHRIPLIFFDKWQRELGIDYWNPDHADAVERLLNSSDYRWLAVGKKNHNVSMSGLKVGADTPIFQAPKMAAGTVLGSDGTPMAAS
jgi:hypothetical protein